MIGPRVKLFLRSYRHVPHLPASRKTSSMSSSGPYLPHVGGGVGVEQSLESVTRQEIRWQARRAASSSTAAALRKDSGKATMHSGKTASASSSAPCHQRMILPSVLLRVFNVLLLLSCSPVGSISAHGAAVTGAKVSTWAANSTIDQRHTKRQSFRCSRGYWAEYPTYSYWFHIKGIAF